MMAILVFTAALILYISTLSPTISVGDSPELISSAYTLGIAHPPGYPLFSLIGKAVTFIPFGDSVAYKVNLLSAFLGSLSVLFLYLTIIEVTGLIRSGSEFGVRGSGLNSAIRNPQSAIIDRLSAFLGSLIFAVSPMIWSQAVVAEVYTLNTAFFTCLLWLGLKWISVGAGFKPAPTARLIYLISFLLGLSLGNHHTMIAFGPIFLLFVGIHWFVGARRRLALGGSPTRPYNSHLASHVSRLTFFFLLGLSVYIYLPIRSLQNPFMDWGNPDGVSSFMDVLLRRQFGIGNKAYSIETGLMQAAYYLGLLREQFTLCGLIFGCAGAFIFAGRSFLPFLFTLSLFLIFGLLTILILNPAPPDFYSMDVMVIPSFAVFSAYIGVGFLLAYSGIISLFTKNLTPDKEKKICLVLTMIFISLPITLFSINLHKINQSGNTFAYDYAYDVTESLDPNGVLFVEADLSLFPVWYIQSVEGVRKDVAVLDVDMLMLPWFKDQLKEKYPTVEIKVPEIIKHATGGKFMPLSMEALESYKVSQVEGMIDNIMERHPIYLSYEFGIPFREFGGRRDIVLVRNGVVFRISKEKTPDKPTVDFRGLQSIVKAIEPKDEEVLFVGRVYIPALERQSSAELTSGRKEQAMEIMEAILTVDPYNSNTLNNLAFLYAEEGKSYAVAENMVKRAMKINPVERVRYLKTLGFVFLKRGEYGKAIDIFKEVLKIEPGSEWTRLRLEEASSKRLPPLAGKD